MQERQHGAVCYGRSFLSSDKLVLYVLQVCVVFYSVRIVWTMELPLTETSDLCQGYTKHYATNVM